MDGIGKTPWSYPVEMTRISSMVDSSSRQCLATYGCLCARMAWAQQRWSNKPHLQYGSDFASCNFWLLTSLKHELCGWNLKTDAQVFQETQMIFGHIPKEKFETTIKKWVERMEECSAALGWYFKKKYVKCALQKWGWCERMNLWFHSFFDEKRL